MPEAKPQEDRLLVAMDGQVAQLRLEGRGSFKISSALKEFGQGVIDAGARTMVFDMGGCIGMDSTFMGVLAGLACRLRARHQGQLTLINLAPRIRSLVSTLGLDQVVRACEAGQTPPELLGYGQSMGGLTALPAGAEDKLRTAETMLEAHEQLVKISADNAPRFKDVLTYLREDLRRKPEPPRDRA